MSARDAASAPGFRAAYNPQERPHRTLLSQAPTARVQAHRI